MNWTLTRLVGSFSEIGYCQKPSFFRSGSWPLMRAAGILLRELCSLKSVANHNSSLFKGTMTYYEFWDNLGHATTFHGMLPWPWHKPEQPPWSFTFWHLADPCGSLWHVRGLTAGKYYLLCQLPQDVQLIGFVGCQVRTNGIQMGRHHLSSSNIIWHPCAKVVTCRTML